ncbi:MAG: DUF6495 family protein [Saprospiraceae bacterium]
MKYRRLSLSELSELESDFVKFLAANTITSDDWVSLKANKPEKVEKLIEVFSDIVFEKVISKVQFLEHRTKHDLRLFECLEDEIKLIGVKVVGVDTIDFTKNQATEDMFSSFQTAPDGSVKMYSANKPYKNNDRSMELYQMMEDGCLISKGELYQTMSEMSKG